jgi:hypothetical protein
MCLPQYLALKLLGKDFLSVFERYELTPFDIGV